MSRHFELIVWTAGEQIYADSVLDILDPNGYISHRFYRKHCVRLDATTFVKHLEQLGRDTSQVALIDNSNVSYAFDLKNGIPIYSYREGQSDVELLEIIPFLLEMKNKDDWRKYIKEYYNLNSIIRSLQGCIVNRNNM